MTPHTDHADTDGAQTEPEPEPEPETENPVRAAEQAQASESYREALYYCNQDSYDRRAHLYVITDPEHLGADSSTLDSACRLSMATDVAPEDDRFEPYHEIADVPEDEQYPGSTQLCLHCRAIWEHIDRPISELVSGSEIKMTRRHYVLKARSLVTEHRRQAAGDPGQKRPATTAAASRGRY